METSEQSLKGYLRLIGNRKNAFILTSVSVITVFLLSGYVMPKIYQAKCSVLVETNVIEKLVQDIAVTPSLEERLRVLDYSMKSRNLLMKVMGDLGFNVNEMGPSETERLVRKFEKNTQINNTRKMDMFIVSYRDRDPVFTRDYVNTLVRRYIEMNIAEKREETLGANRFLSEQIKFFKEKLDDAESEIVLFRKDRGIFVAIDERKVVDEIKIAQEKVGELKLTKDELLARKKMIKKTLIQCRYLE
jgi:polysaccharide chain length determinant protein (PEP-CTERM system associated)